MKDVSSNDMHQNILISYAYASKNKALIQKATTLHKEGKINLMIDSGAFTAFNAKGDFKHIKEKIHGQLDHANLNDILPFNPTAENISRWIVEQIPQCYKASVQESEGNIAVYVKEGINSVAL